MRRFEGVVARFVGATATWLFGLTLLVVVHALASERSRVLSAWDVGWRLTHAVGALLPFVAFAGGAAVARLEPLTRKGLTGFAAAALGTAAVAYSANAIGAPILRYERDVAAETVREATYPFGAWTPRARLQQHAFVERNPPAAYSNSTGEPLARRPAVIAYVLHRDVALAVFAVLNGMLGLLAGRTALRRPWYRPHRVMWGAGLAASLMVIVPGSLLTSLVLTSDTSPGAVLAWLPLVLPLATIVWLARGPGRPALAEEPVAGEAVRS